MNSLSWLIYWASVLGSVSNALGIIFAVSGLVSAGCVLGYLIAITNDCGREEETLSLKRLAKRSAIVAVAAMASSIPIPSAETVYAIAASEAGEKALTSETGAKAVKALNAWLDKQIGDQK